MTHSYNLYEYSPSPVAAMIFLILFALATFCHMVIVLRKRAWYFFALLFGGILEVAGYVGRFISTSNQSSITPFIIQTLCLLVAPALFAASIYMILGRLIIFLHAASLSPIRPTWLTKIFVGGDILSFFIQVMGAGMLAKAGSADTGKMIILIGLVVQLIFFGLFVVAAAVFHRRYVNGNWDLRAEPESGNQRDSWKRIMMVLYASSTLIFVRSLFRLAEYIGDKDGPLMTNEAFLYVFDSLLMVGVMVVILIYHPTKYLPSKKGVLLLQNLSSH